ncbi:MAG TPA: hypothetical protein VK449_03665, partial [Anaerolineales bacterium]|nr:hypothetical protein [Anaerolineales bacterium]
MSAISGSSAYYVLILSGLVILLVAALARRSPAAQRDGASPPLTPLAGTDGQREADRWAIAAGMLVGLQGLRLLTAVWAPASVLLPLLDRLFSVLLPALMGWAALGPQVGEAADRLLTAIVVLAGAGFAASALLGTTPIRFNLSVFDQVWSLLALAISAGALAAVVVRRPPQWGVFAGALGLLVAGDLAHIATIPITESSAPYVLLAEALAVPLFTVGAIWSFLREAPQPASKPPLDLPVRLSLSAFVEMD